MSSSQTKQFLVKGARRDSGIQVLCGNTMPYIHLMEKMIRPKIHGINIELLLVLGLKLKGTQCSAHFCANVR